MDHVLSELQRADKNRRNAARYNDTFIGCFTKIENYFNYNQGFLYNLKMTIEICKNFCSKHVYAWLKIGVECTCSDTLEDLHRIEKALCDVNCRGSHDQICGGSKEDSFSIYSTNKVLSSLVTRLDDTFSTTMRTTTRNATIVRADKINIFRANMSRYRNETFELYSICEFNFKNEKSCFLLPIYITEGVYNNIFICMILVVLICLLVVLVLSFHQKIRDFIRSSYSMLKIQKFKEKIYSFILRKPRLAANEFVEK